MPIPTKISPAIKKLKDGNIRFINNSSKNQGYAQSTLEEIAQRQRPEIAILSCSDSRVSPEVIFDARLGELFVVRVVGNVASNTTMASLEFAVNNLGSKVVIVLGHSNCGAIATSRDEYATGGILGDLIENICTTDKDGNKLDAMNDAIRGNCDCSVTKIINTCLHFKEKIRNKQLVVISAYYDLETGKVDFNDDILNSNDIT